MSDIWLFELFFFPISHRLSMVELRPSSSLSTGCVVSLRGDWAIFCHAGSGRVGRVRPAREKSLEILRRGWERRSIMPIIICVSLDQGISVSKSRELRFKGCESVSQCWQGFFLVLVLISLSLQLTSIASDHYGVDNGVPISGYRPRSLQGCWICLSLNFHKD